jgi:hypothetical protein
MINWLSLRCPGCDAKLRAQFALIGRSCPCPRCKRRVLVQPSAPSDSGVALVPHEDEHGTPWKSQAP